MPDTAFFDAYGQQVSLAEPRHEHAATQVAGIRTAGGGENCTAVNSRPTVYFELKWGCHAGLAN